jgi:phospholipid transport system transporter-binding protein
MAKRPAAASASNEQKKAAKAEEPAVNEVAAIVLEGSLDIAGAEQLRERLLQALSAKQNVTVDATNVERVDTAALQVLTAFFKDAVAQNMDIQWQDTSQTFNDAARLLGLHDALHLH